MFSILLTLSPRSRFLPLLRLPALHESASIAPSVRRYVLAPADVEFVPLPELPAFARGIAPGPPARTLVVLPRACSRNSVVCASPSSAHLRRLITDSVPLPDTRRF